AAFVTRLFDHFAAAVAVGARPLDHEQALVCPHFAASVAQVAAAPRSARLCPGATAWFARDRHLDLDLGGLAAERVLGAHLHVVAQGRSAPGAAAAAAGTEGAAEDGFEDVAQVSEILLLAASAHALGEGRMAEPVISRALLRILQAVVSRADGLELAFVFLAARVPVRMVLHRQL